MEEIKQEYLNKFFSEEDAPIDPEEIWEWCKQNVYRKGYNDALIACKDCPLLMEKEK